MFFVTNILSGWFVHWWSGVLFAFKAKCFGDSSSQCQSLGLENLKWGSEPLHLFGELLQCDYFPICRLHTQQVLHLIVTRAHILPSYCGSFFVFECKISFLVFQSFFIVGCSVVSCDFGIFARWVSILLLSHFLWNWGAFLSLKACCLFPHCELTIISLIQGVQINHPFLIHRTAGAGPGTLPWIS